MDIIAYSDITDEFIYDEIDNTLAQQDGLSNYDPSDEDMEEMRGLVLEYLAFDYKPLWADPVEYREEHVLEAIHRAVEEICG